MAAADLFQVYDARAGRVNKNIAVSAEAAARLIRGKTARRGSDGYAPDERLSDDRRLNFRINSARFLTPTFWKI